MMKITRLGSLRGDCYIMNSKFMMLFILRERHFELVFDFSYNSVVKYFEVSRMIFLHIWNFHIIFLCSLY